MQRGGERGLHRRTADTEEEAEDEGERAEQRRYLYLTLPIRAVHTDTVLSTLELLISVPPPYVATLLGMDASCPSYPRVPQPRVVPFIRFRSSEFNHCHFPPVFPVLYWIYSVLCQRLQ